MQLANMIELSQILKDQQFEITFKKIKMFNGLEGYGVNADVYVNNVRCFHLIDDASGGSAWLQTYQFESKKKNDLVVSIEKALDSIVEGYYVKWDDPGMDKPDGFKVKWDLAQFMNEYLAEFQLEKDLKKWCKVNTMFYIMLNGVKTLYELKVCFSPEVDAHLNKTYGSNLIEIVNKRYPFE